MESFENVVLLIKSVKTIVDEESLFKALIDIKLTRQ